MYSKQCTTEDHTFFNSVFDDFLREDSSSPKISPRTRAVDRQTSVTVELEMPGVDKENIRVEVKDGVLSVSAEKALHKADEKTRVAFNEIASGQYSRSFRLSDDIEGEGVEARYTNGVLYLELRKKEESHPRHIPVQ